MFAILILGVGLPGVATAGPAMSLTVGRDERLTMEAGDRRRLRVHLTAGDWLATVEQRGMDVTLEVIDPDGESLGTVDSPLDRRGLERFLFSSERMAVHELEIVAREEGAPAGMVSIRLDRVPVDGSRRAALVADTDAARRYYEGGVEAWRAAVDAHRTAAIAWRKVGDIGAEARAVYGAAVVLRLLGDLEALSTAKAVVPLWQTMDDTHWLACTFNEIGLGHLGIGEPAAARDAFERALALRVREDEAGVRMELQQNICVAYLSEGRRTVARDCFAPVLDQLDAIASPASLIAVLINVAALYRSLGDTDRALALYRQGQEKAAAIGDDRSQARAQSGAAAALRDLGRYREAGLEDESALMTFDRLEDRRWQGTTLNNLGYGLLELGETRRARSYLERALTLRLASDDPRGAATTLENLGTSWRLDGETEPALERLNEAHRLRRGLGDHRGEAKALRLLAIVEAQAGKPDVAAARLVQARLLLSDEDRRERALVDLEAAQLAFDRDQPADARVMLRTVIEDLETAGDRRALVQARTLASRTALALGQPDVALRLGQQAIAGVESLRADVASAHLRATLLGEQRGAYEAAIDALLNGADTEGVRRAFELSERARARSLLETLRPTDRSSWRGVDAVLLERRQQLQARLNAKAGSRLALADHGSPEDRGKLDLELASLSTDLEAVDAAIRRASPRYRTLTRPQPVELDAAQQHLRDGTITLAYWLGVERSHLWWISAYEVHHVVLPPGAQIDRLARRVRDGVSAQDAGSAARERADLRALSEMILGPIADRLAGQRLAVITDGALHYLPFGFLPLPKSASNVPLIDRHEVVHLPSLSVLSALRSMTGRSRDLEDLPVLAVVADPIFGSTDPRLRPSRNESLLRTGSERFSVTRGSSFERLDRLPGSRREADAIASVAPSGDVVLFLGFDATRERVLAEALRGHRVVHFATHGIFDAEYPGLSGLALTQRDRSGARLDGFLRFADLIDLELDAELVVLSGCETALGQAVAGEGLMGLTSGFMAAGAPRVVASAWRVQDQATAALMTAFHRALWQGGLSPAAALRMAQQAVRGQRAWRDPYFWAGFVLVGDWTGWARSSPSR